MQAALGIGRVERMIAAVNVRAIGVRPHPRARH
jgi:hypothetical protein